MRAVNNTSPYPTRRSLCCSQCFHHRITCMVCGLQQLVAHSETFQQAGLHLQLMDASDPERDIAYRRIHGLEGGMPGPGNRGEDRPRCCAWLVHFCRCLIGDVDVSQDNTPRSRAMENHLYQYEAPAVPSTSETVVQQQRPAVAFEEDADVGPLLPKTAESSAPVPRPSHSRNNSSASATAAAAAAAASSASVGGESFVPPKRHSCHEPQSAGVLGPGSGEPSRPAHRRTGSQSETLHRRGKSDGVVPLDVSAAAVAGAAAAAAAAAAGGQGLPSTAAGRPGTVFGPVQDEEDDICPTCLDQYNDVNPKIFTECGHHFHLHCIYAWLERKNTCPMCESPMQAPGL